MTEKRWAKAPTCRTHTDPDAQLTPNKEDGVAPNYLPAAGVDATTGAYCV